MTRLAFLSVVAVIASTTANAQSATVQRVIDGDTIVACTATCQTVRISNIDAPEMPPKSKCQKEEQRALDATKRLTAMIQGRNVEIVVDARSRDRYGRTLAQVRFNGKDVGEALIAAGVARKWAGRREPWC